MSAYNRKTSLFICLSAGLIVSALCSASAARLTAQDFGTQPPVPAATAAKDAPAADPTSPGRQAADLAQSLDQLLTDAMDRNPAIVTAKAKVALAQAELNAAQMEVSQHIISLWNEQKAQEQSLEIASQKLQRIEGLVKSGTANVEESLPAKSAVIEAQAKLSKIQNELRSSIGQIPPAIRKSASASLPTGEPPLDAPIELPQGRVATSIRKALDQKTTVEFSELPITDVVDYLKDVVKPKCPDFEFTIDLHIAKSAPPVTLNLRGQPLSAVLQALEDQFQDFVWVFVVRDYGLLLTDSGTADGNQYLRVRDFMRRIAAEKDDLRQMLSRKVDVKNDNIKIDELLSGLLEPAGISFELASNNIRKAMPNTAIDVKGVSIGSILQTLEDKNEGTQFVVKDDCIILTLRDYAQKRGWLPLTEFLKQSKPNEEKHGEQSPPKDQPVANPLGKR
jgi:hypothetical protein